MHTYIHIYIHIYIHAYIFTYIYIYTHTYIYILIDTYRYRFRCRYIYIYIDIYFFTYINKYKCIYIHTHTHIYIYIYPEKDAVRSPFSTFLGMQCFCYIMFDHLCSYTCDGIARDPHRLSDFLRKERPESHEDPQRKGRRKNKHSVCIYIYGFP